MVRVFAFEPSLILATKDHDYLLRSDSHDSVKFKVKADTSGDFYKFEDLRYGKALYSENFKDANSREGIKVRFGNGDDAKFYWKIILTDNAEFFYLKNKANGHYLSSDEENICISKSFFGSCTNEWMNKAYGDVNGSNVKWMFTEFLIRKGILPDRRQG